jgi:fatty acid desaturase
MNDTRSGSLVLPDSPESSSLPERASPNLYAELKRTMKQKGLLEKQPVYYSFRIALLLVLLVVGIVFFLLAHSFWLQLLNAVYLAFVFTQIGLLSHEAGHRQMFNHIWKHDLLGLIGGNLMIGMSFAWWLDKHNNHHSHPNQVDMDPDVDIPFLEFTGLKDLKQVSKLRQFLIKHQAWIFLPALMTVSLGLQQNSFLFLLKNRTKYYFLEWALFIGHYILYLGLIFSHLSWWQAIIFIAINQAATGFYLGSIFAPNHKGMPVLERQSKVDFLHRQIMTARNIYPHPVIDFCYGGLNYQIEHHLFPAMARNQLKEARQVVKSFCQENEIPYYETNAIQSLREILQHLYAVGEPLRV